MTQSIVKLVCRGFPQQEQRSTQSPIVSFMKRKDSFRNHIIKRCIIFSNTNNVLAFS